jgi:hypothetical protein
VQLLDSSLAFIEPIYRDREVLFEAVEIRPVYERLTHQFPLKELQVRIAVRLLLSRETESIPRMLTGFGTP